MPAKRKLHPDIIKAFCSQYELNEVEDSLCDKFYDEYNKFYQDGRFKYFDSYIEAYQKNQNCDNKEFYSNMLILVECLNLSSKLFHNELDVEIYDLNNFLLKVPLPTADIKTALKNMLLIYHDRVNTEEDLKMFIDACISLKTPYLPDVIKFSCMFIPSAKNIRPIDLNCCLVTFLADVNYKELERYLNNMNYSIVIKVFKENNKFFIKIYDVDRENKILNCRNNRRNITVKFIYNES